MNSRIGKEGRRFLRRMRGGPWWPIPALLLFFALAACGSALVKEADESDQGAAIVVITITASPTPTPLPTPTPPTSKVGGLEEAARRWQAAGLTDYRIRLREVHSVWCSYEVSLEVRQGEVVTCTVRAIPGPADDCRHYTDRVVWEPVGLSPSEGARWTVPGLFEIARGWRQLAGTADMRIVLEFDPELGYPTALLKDNVVAIDDELYLKTESFLPR